MSTTSFRPLILFALVFAALMAAGLVVRPPAVRADNAAGQFDADAAFARLGRVLRPETPHPLDSDAADAVRGRLVAEIEALGYRPEVHEHFACRPQPRTPSIDCGRVRNIMFSAGPADGPAVLAATHYDSVPAGPGASDAGVGIASWLEIARLVRDEPLARRIIFLISDGEEPALLGAYAFAQLDPLMAEVEAIVNLEARGTRGPAIFFETNQPNADAIRTYGASVHRPLANSIMADVYAILPNTTDVTVLKREGLDIVNIALLDGWEDYHTPQDNLASFDRRSLQHMGDGALATLRAFARAEDAGSGARLVFTDIATRGFVSLPVWAGLAGLGISALIALAVFWRSGGEGRWKAFALPPAALIAAALLAFAIGFALNLLRPGDYWFAYPLATRAWIAFAAFAGVALAFLALARGVRAAHIEAAAMAWFALLGLAGSLALNGLSALFLFSAAAYALGALLALRWPIAAPIAATAAALIALVLWAPVLHLMEVALGYQFPAVTAAVTAVVMLPWFGALKRLNGEASWRGTGFVLDGAVVACVVLAAASPSNTPARPRALNIVYVQDTIAEEAQFLAGRAGRPLPPEIARAGEFSARLAVPGDEVESWSAPAPYENLPSPLVRVLGEDVDGETRRVRLGFTSNGAYRIWVRIPREAAPAAARMNNAEASFADVSDFGDFVSLSCIGRACDGAEAIVTLGADADPTQWLVLGQYLGAPAVAAPLVAARPDTATPIQSGDAVLTLGRVAPPG